MGEGEKLGIQKGKWGIQRGNEGVQKVFVLSSLLSL